jgi:hypothetical protein
MLPIVAFIIVGRTVEIERDRYPRSISGMSDQSDTGEIVTRALNVTKKLGLGLSGTSSAGAGFSEPFLAMLSSVKLKPNSYIDPLSLATYMYPLDPLPTSPG